MNINNIYKLLLYHQASPWSTVHYDLKTLTEDEIMLSLLRLSRQVIYILHIYI